MQTKKELWFHGYADKLLANAYQLNSWEMTKNGRFNMIKWERKIKLKNVNWNDMNNDMTQMMWMIWSFKLDAIYLTKKKNHCFSFLLVEKPRWTKCLWLIASLSINLSWIKKTSWISLTCCERSSGWHVRSSSYRGCTTCWRSIVCGHRTRFVMCSPGIVLNFQKESKRFAISFNRFKMKF